MKHAGVCFILVLVILLSPLFTGCAGANVPGFDSPLSGDTVQQKQPDQADEPTQQEIDPKWKELIQQNPDLVGWVSVTGTTIDYPIVQSADNDFYLRRDFYGEYSVFGTPFLDCGCGLAPRCDNAVIYGHATPGGELFGQLNLYLDDTLDEYPRITIDDLYQSREYRVFAAFIAPLAGSQPFDYTQCYFAGDTQRLEFIRTAQALSAVDFDVYVSHTDTLLTLQTCTYGNGNARLVVMGIEV